MSSWDVINQTRRFLGDEMSWEFCRIELRNVRGLWGGRNLFISGRGLTILQSVSPNQVEKRYEFELSRSQIVALLIRFIEYNFLTIHLPIDSQHKGESFTEITLINSLGGKHSVTRTGEVEHAGFEAIYQELLRIEVMTQQLEPVYIGPYSGEVA